MSQNTKPNIFTKVILIVIVMFIIIISISIFFPVETPTQNNAKIFTEHVEAPKDSFYGMCEEIQDDNCLTYLCTKLIRTNPAHNGTCGLSIRPIEDCVGKYETCVR